MFSSSLRCSSFGRKPHPHRTEFNFLPPDGHHNHLRTVWCFWEGNLHFFVNIPVRFSTLYNLYIYLWSQYIKQINTQFHTSPYNLTWNFKHNITHKRILFRTSHQTYKSLHQEHHLGSFWINYSYAYNGWFLQKYHF